MKVLMQVREIRPAEQGQRRSDESTWTRWPVIFEEPGTSNAMILHIYRAELPQKLYPGAIGNLYVEVNLNEYNGRTYNEFRYQKFEALGASTRDTGTQPPTISPQAPQNPQGVQSPTMPPFAPQIQNTGQTTANNKPGDDMPW